MSDNKKVENKTISVPVQKNSEPVSAGISPIQFIQGDGGDNSNAE